MKISTSIFNYFIPQPIQKNSNSSELNTSEETISIKNGNNTPIHGIPSVLDSLIRGIGRFAETKIDNYFQRIGFRFVTENVRYASSRILLNLFQQKDISLDILSIGLKKSLEITLGTAIVDPNRETEHLKRMGRGFLNMVSRLGSRIGLIGLKVLEPNQFSFNTLIDEFASRTICRIFYINSENSIIGVACRTVEQFSINEWVRNLPAYRFILSKLNPEDNKANIAPEEAINLRPAN